MTISEETTAILTAWAEWACRQPIGMTKPNDLSPPIAGLRVCNTMEEVEATASQDAEKDAAADIIDGMTEEELLAFRRYKSVESAIEKLEALAGSILPAGKLRSLLIHVYWSGGDVGSWQGIHWPEPSMPRTLLELGWHPEIFLSATISRVAELIECEDSDAA